VRAPLLELDRSLEKGRRSSLSLTSAALSISAAATSGLPLGVYMQHDPRDLAPVGAVRIGIEQAQIGDQVLFVVPREHWIGRRQIGTIGVEGWPFHECARRG
jgi:hypothetical protein